MPIASPDEPVVVGGESAPGPRERRREAGEVVIRVPRLDRILREIFPEETLQHLRAARREQLLAVRSLLDHAIERIDDEDRRAEADRAPRRVEIPLDAS